MTKFSYFSRSHFIQKVCMHTKMHADYLIFNFTCMLFVMHAYYFDEKMSYFCSVIKTQLLWKRN